MFIYDHQEPQVKILESGDATSYAGAGSLITGSTNTC